MKYKSFVSFPLRRTMLTIFTNAMMIILILILMMMIIILLFSMLCLGGGTATTAVGTMEQKMRGHHRSI